MKNFESAEYISKAIGWSLYGPMFVGSLLLILVSLQTGELWMKLVGVGALIISPLLFWVSQKVLWQFIASHALLSLVIATYCMMFSLYDFLKNGFTESTFGNVFLGAGFAFLAQRLFLVSRKRKAFLSIFDEQKSE